MVTHKYTPIKRWPVAIWLFLLRLYRYGLSPLLPVACRFEPSCATYSAEAVQKHGLRYGIWLTIRRVLRCHPFSGKSGYDPVP